MNYVCLSCAEFLDANFCASCGGDTVITAEQWEEQSSRDELAFASQGELVSCDLTDDMPNGGWADFSLTDKQSAE